MNPNDIQTPSEYQAEFNQLVEEHGLPGAIRKFWNTHTSISLKKLGSVMILLYSARYVLISWGVKPFHAVILSLVVVFLTAQVFYLVYE